MKPWFEAFFAGWLMDSAVKSLYQDAIGQQAYIKLIEAAWISAWYTVPLAVAMIFISLAMLRSAIKGFNK